MLSGSSLLGVDVENSPTGISVGNVAIAATSNTNGVSIQKVNSSANTSTFDVFITTPPFGYVNNPFEVGDSVFIEGLQKVGVAGSGFNSSDYGYKFLSVVGEKTKLNIKELKYISPLWTYKLLTYLSVFMIVGEIIAFVI